MWKILKNPVYGGTAYYRKQRVERLAGGKRALHPRLRTEQIAIPVQQIVDPAAVMAVERQFEYNRRQSLRNTKRFYLLRGLVRCGGCGHVMVGKSAGRGASYYSCAQSDQHDRGLAHRCRWHAVSAPRLEALVWEQVRLALQSPDVILDEARRYRDRRFGQRDEVLARLDHLHHALERLLAERDREQTLYVEGYATLEETRVRLDRLARKRQGLEAEHRTLIARLEGQLADEQRDELLERIVEQTRQRLAELSDRERQDVVRAVIDRVIVGDDHTVEIHGYLPASQAPGQHATISPAIVYRQMAWEPTTESEQVVSIAPLTS